MPARLPKGVEVGELGYGEFRGLSLGDLRELSEPTTVVDKRSNEKLAVLIPYAWYLETQKKLALLETMQEHAMDLRLKE